MHRVTMGAKRQRRCHAPLVGGQISHWWIVSGFGWPGGSKPGLAEIGTLHPDRHDRDDQAEQHDAGRDQEGREKPAAGAWW
jgi:hypothetical protein